MNDQKFQQSVVNFAAFVVFAFFNMALFAMLNMSLKHVLWIGFGTVLVGLLSAGFPTRFNRYK